MTPIASVEGSYNDNILDTFTDKPRLESASISSLSSDPSSAIKLSQAKITACITLDISVVSYVSIEDADEDEDKDGRQDKKDEKIMLEIQLETESSSTIMVTPSAACGDGNVKLIYEQYDEMFPIVNGSTNEKFIDDLYCFSYIMPGCKLHLSVYDPAKKRELEISGIQNLYLPEKPSGTFQTLEVGCTYYIYVEQKKEQLKSDQERMRKVAAGMQGRTI